MTDAYKKIHVQLVAFRSKLVGGGYSHYASVVASLKEKRMLLLMVSCRF